MAKERSQKEPQQERKLRDIRIPDGLPPVKLTGKVTPDSIRAWCYETRLAFKKRGYNLLSDGVIYLLDMYFIDPNDHPRQNKAAVAVIMGTY
jgi:hypothetical protein